MTRRFSVPLAVAVCAAAAAWWAYPERPAVGGQGPAVALVTKWEYATLSYQADDRLGDRPSLEFGGKEVRGKDWKELAEQAKFPVKGENVGRGAVLNALGAQGWELVSHAATTKTQTMNGQTWNGKDTYTFKRRAP